MIVPMMKYSFVVHHADYEGFIGELQELGLVDITISDWEASEREYHLLNLIEKQRSAMADLAPLAADASGAKPFPTPEETLEVYIKTSDEVAKAKADIAKTEKEMEEAEIFGRFSAKELQALKSEAGVEIRIFTAYSKEFSSGIGEWSRSWAIEKINEKDAL